jgi:L-rhamnose-H+ transport protein
MLWGIGGHSFGLSLRYLGMSLGMAIALGMTHIAGTLAPPIFMGTFQSLIRSLSGQVIMAGLAVCIIGTFLAGFAGILKENDSSPDNKQKYIKEYNFKKGIIVTVLSGILSACFTFAFDASKPIADVAVKHGISELWKNNVGLVFITAGSFISNAILCLVMNIKNKSISNYWQSGDASIWINYLFCAAAGIIAYLEFLFYGMGITKMGKNDFVSFSIHLVFIIIFSTMWGWITLEFKGSSKRTVTMIIIGILVLILSVVVMAYGNYLSFIA